MNAGRILAIGTPPTFRQEVAQALGLAGDAVDWLPSVTAAEEFLVLRHMSPNLLVLSPEVKEPDALGVADFVIKSSPTTAVILVRERAVNGLLPAAMKAGIRAVVDLSQGNDDLGDALERNLEWSMGVQAAGDNGDGPPDARGKIVSVFSSKGGVGKTFLSSNLAVALAMRSEEPTALVDFDLKVGDSFSYFGREPTRPLADMIAVGDARDPQAILGPGTELRPHLWAYGALPDPAADSMPGDTAGKVLRALRSCFEYTVVDASNDYSDQTVAVFDLSDEIWLVTGLDVVGMRHLVIAMDTLRSLGISADRIKVILNRSDSKVGVSLSDVERVLKVNIDGKIPSSDLVPRSLNLGTPIVVGEPKSEVATAIAGFAETLIGTESMEAEPAAAERRKFRAVLGLG